MLFDLPLRPDTEPEFDDVLGAHEETSDPAAETLREIPIDGIGEAAPAGPADLILDESPRNTPEYEADAEDEDDTDEEEGRDHLGDNSSDEREDQNVAEIVPIQTKLFQHDDEEEEEELLPEESSISPLTDRVLGGISDLAVHAAMLGVAAAGCYGLGVRVSLADWMPFTLLTLIFSFLYWTIPLTFWGQTPGMAWIGNVARNLDDEPLYFGQAMKRWVGALLTLALAGLPILASLGGRSLSDWLSDSKTELG